MPAHLDYPDKMMHEMVYETVMKYPHNGALQYYGKTLSYKNFMKNWNMC